MKKFKIKSILDSENDPHDRQKRISWWSQEKLKQANVMVVGAGAIGNETLKNLALLGIGNIFIVDFDTISTSNLSRTVLFRKEDVGKRKAEIAAIRTKELSLYEDVRVNWFHGDLVWELGTGLYRNMDIILGCLDNVETRMAVNKNCWLTNTPWIDAGMYELGLRVEFYCPPQLPCYQCNLTKEQLQNVNRRYSCDFFKKKAFEEGKMPTTQITSAIVSALQVQEAVKYLCGMNVITGKKIYFQGQTNDFDIFTKMIDDECLAHANYPNIIDLPINSNIHLKDFLKFISGVELSGENATLDMRGDRTFVKSITCKSCGEKIKIMRPTFKIDSDETICKKCNMNIGEKSHFDDTTEVGKITQDEFNIENTDLEILNMSLHDIGIPYLHVIAVYSKAGDYKYYELSDDRKFLLNN